MEAAVAGFGVCMRCRQVAKYCRAAYGYAEVLCSTGQFVLQCCIEWWGDGRMLSTVTKGRGALEKSYDSVRRSVSVSRDTWFCDLCWQLRHYRLRSMCGALYAAYELLVLRFMTAWIVGSIT
jgi:hypothetical protein